VLPAARSAAIRAVRPAALPAVVPERLGAEELAAALAAGDVRFHYQPRFDVRTQRVSGAEALARWTHPRRGVVPPVSFIPLAERSGLITDLTIQAVDAVTAAARRWQLTGAALPVAVNFSPHVLSAPRVLFGLFDALERTGLPPHLLEVEITETGLAEHPQALESVHAVAGAGVRVVLDDFGTGYSGLSALRRLPVDAVKIDIRFIRSLHRSARDQALVRNMINLVHDLGAEVVAEGVEEPDTLRYLLDYGCDHAQGFLLARPAPGLPSCPASWLAAG